MNSGKIRSIPIGSLVRDTDQGDIGIIVGPLVEVYLGALGYCRTQLVIWPDARQPEPVDLDLVSIEEGLIEVISENG